MTNPLSIDEQFIINIFEKYQKVKVILAYEGKNLQETAVVYDQEPVSPQKMAEYQHYLQIVDIILALLPPEEYTCLLHEFINCSTKDWWKKHYREVTYQKLKHKAINRFLYLFLL